MESAIITAKYLTNNIDVPQRSNLGPLLFIIFKNNICKLKLNGLPQLFAVNLAIQYKNFSNKILLKHMQDNLFELEKWFNTNKFVVNGEKIKYMLFEPPNMNDSYHLFYKHEIVERDDKYTSNSVATSYR